MRTTIGTFLTERGVEITRTVYKEEEADFLSFPILAGDFLKWGKLAETYREFQIYEHYQIYLDNRKRNKEYRQAEENIQTCMEILSCFKQHNDTHTYQDFIKEIRSRRKKLEEQKEALEEKYKKEAAQVCLQEESLLLTNVISYKDIFYLTSGRQLIHFIKEIKKSCLQGIEKKPFFVTSLLCLQEALKSAGREKQSIGIEGGPCLFGHDEVTIRIVHDGGEVFHFDYSDPKNYEMENGSEGDEETLAAHVTTYGKQISSMTFHKKKKGVTVDEFQSLLYVFAFAHALQAKVIIPIPDMSYRKYLTALCGGIRQSAAEPAQREFKELVYGITDQYLQCIGKIHSEYAHIEVEVLHERNEGLCRQFYQAREPYCQGISVKRILTSHSCKEEAILDYITMPALPFYRWGIKNVVQIDCISEADSFRKCMKLHGKAFNLHGLFYPEEVGKDGEHTMFSAQNQWKEYVEL